MIQSYRFRLYPNQENEQALLRTLEQCRLTYNRLLEEMNKQDNPNRYELQAMLPKWKEDNDNLRKVYSKTLQYEVYRLFSNLKSLGQLKKKGRKVGKLRFKGKGWFKTFTYNQSGFKVVNTGNRLNILHLSKIGDIPIRLHREIEGNIKQIIIKRERTGKWFAIIQADNDRSKPEQVKIKSAVGIDVGLTNFAHDSDNTIHKNPRTLKKNEKRLAREQRKLARKKKGSKNYKKQKLKVARAYEKVVNQRDDYLHKLSRYYVDNYDLIVSEKLDIMGMMKSTKSEVRHKKIHKKQGRGRNRNILDVSWDKFNQMLSYKSENDGKVHLLIDPEGTSQECSECGDVVNKGLDVRVHRCPSCGFIANRDYNASRNILNRGIEKIGQGLSEFTPVDTDTSTCSAMDGQVLVLEAGSQDLKSPSVI